MGSLLVDASGKFSNARFEEAKRILYAALGEGDRWLNEALSMAKNAGSGPAKAYAGQLTAGVPTSLERLRFFRKQVDDAAKSTNDFLWSTDLAPLRKVTRYAFMLEQIRQEIGFHKATAEGLGLAEQETFWRALAESAAAFGVRVYEGLKPAIWFMEHLGTIALVALGIIIVPRLLRAGRGSSAFPPARPSQQALSGLRFAPSRHLPKRRKPRTRRRRGRIRENA